MAKTQEQSNGYFPIVKTTAEEHNPVKILNYIFNNCSADDNADEANIEDQTTQILREKKNTTMVSHFSITMPKFETIPVQHCHFKVPS